MSSAAASGSSPASIRDLLRSATAGCHDEVDARFAPMVANKERTRSATIHADLAEVAVPCPAAAPALKAIDEQKKPGYGEQIAFPTQFAAVPKIRKPYSTDTLRTALQNAKPA